MRRQLAFSFLVIFFASQLSLAGDKSAPVILWSQLAKLSELNGIMHGFGASVAVDGNVVVVGAPLDGNSEQGQAYVFVRSGSNWGNMTQTATLTASDAHMCNAFGTSVSISGDTIVVGAAQAAFFCQNSAPGAAYVFVKPQGGWSGTLTETAKLTASDGVSGDALGLSVSIRGNAVVAGAPGTFPTNRAGAAYVFIKPSTGWVTTTQTAKLEATDQTLGNGFGTSVSVSGTAVLVGSPFADVGPNGSQGAAYVFVQPPGGWSNRTQTAKLTASDGKTDDDLGVSVSLNGGTAAAGAIGATIGSNTAQGAAYIFVEPASGWTNSTQTAKLTASNGFSGDNLGASIAVDGGRLLAGAPYYSRGVDPLSSPFFHEGAVYEFLKPATGWTNATQSAAITGSDARYGAYFGTSVGLNGQTTASGALFNNYNLGAAYLFNVP